MYDNIYVFMFYLYSIKNGIQIVRICKKLLIVILFKFWDLQYIKNTKIEIIDFSVLFSNFTSLNLKPENYPDLFISSFSKFILNSIIQRQLNFKLLMNYLNLKLVMSLKKTSNVYTVNDLTLRTFLTHYNNKDIYVLHRL